MPRWSSSAKVAFPRKLSGASISLHDGHRREERRAQTFDLKEIQRRAFERGRLVEREQSSGPLQSLVKKLAAEAEQHGKRLESDSERVEEFGVRLGLCVAERLTGRILAEHEHDIRAIVEEVLSEIRERQPQGSLTIEAAPADAGRLLESFGGQETRGLEITESPSIQAGDFVIRGEDCEYWSTMTERLEALRVKMIDESRDA